MVRNEIVAIKAVEDFLRNELDDYGWEYKVTDTEDHGGFVYVDAGIDSCRGNKKYSTFRVSNFETYDPEKCKLEIDMYEDCFEEIDTFSWKVKYFWIALLNG